MDSFPGFPRVNAVQPETEAFLTTEFGMGSGKPSSYGRPRVSNIGGFKKLAVNSNNEKSTISPPKSRGILSCFFRDVKIAGFSVPEIKDFRGLKISP